jgi:protein-histidine pros-kinase
MGLRAKFNLVMLAAFLPGIALAAVLTRQIALDSARGQVLEQAAMLMGQATAVRGYTQREIAPLLAEQSAVRFLPHTIPSFAAQTVLRAMMQPDFRDYSYKEAALNPTNPADRATDWETDIIDLFRRDAALKEHVGERDTPVGPVLTLSRPFRLTDQGCLSCHSTPAAAPRTMVDLYGPANGFGWKLGDVIGAQVVSVPMRLPLERADRILFTLLGALAAVFVLVLVLVNVLLHVVIIRPVQRITAMAQRAAEGDLEGGELKDTGRDEIGSLARSFNLLKRSLARSMALLETP